MWSLAEVPPFGPVIFKKILLNNTYINLSTQTYFFYANREYAFIANTNGTLTKIVAKAGSKHLNKF